MAPENGTGSSGRSPGSSFLSHMADHLGTNARAEAVYGPAVVQDGVTVIPVARVRWGFGGGNGVSSGSEEKDGSGGGGGVVVKPIGYLELKDGGSKFRPIRDPGSTAAVILAAGVAFSLILRAVRRFVGSIS